MLVFLVALGALILACSAKKLRLDWKPPFDTYETFDPKFGRVRRPYLTSEPDVASGEFQAVLHLSTSAVFAWPGLRFLASKFRSLAITLDSVDAPDGMQVTLAEAREDWRQFGPDQEAMESTVEPYFPFVLRLSGEVRAPSLVTVRITAATAEGEWPFAFLARSLKTSSHLMFFVGPDLGTTWVGFDPGTSGSCIAAGVHGDSIVVEQDQNQQDRITPSLVVFGSFWEKGAAPKLESNTIPESCRLTGTRAQADFGLPGTASFQSFKRFLGYREPIKLSFEHGDLIFEGKDLSRLLVRHVYETFEKYLTDRHPEIALVQSKQARCVVAIPNTFTLTQAQAMREVVADLGKFSEVRCLTEAEAVFFYHLSRLREVPTDRPRTVMVFDMGGSTMNATILRFKALDLEGQRRYKVEILGRMGYGIGGDAIDYYLVRALCRALRSDLGESFRPFDPFVKHRDSREQGTLKQQWNRAAGEIKVRHGAMMAKRERLTSNEALLDIINDAVFEGNLEALVVGPQFQKLFETNAPWPEHPLHSQPELLQGVFLPMDELVREVMQGTQGVQLDAVIYSGRSCRFPSITDRVRDALRKERQSPREILLPDQDLKSAVARGCCWYGLNHTGILVSAPTTSATYGFRHTSELGRTDFVSLIRAGAAFKSLTGNDQVASISGGEKLLPPSDFAFDNRQVVYFQVMGSTKAALAEGQRHRITPLLSLAVRDCVTSVRMHLTETDTSEHSLTFEKEPELTRSSDLDSLTMREHVDEHFYWFLGKKHYDLR
ncbi:MAG: hypothetical protein ACI8T1_000453 [Verrucomicrobiales bacterium]|jgi:hypothetical protein